MKTLSETVATISPAPRWWPIATDARACCCPAEPIAQAVIGSTEDRLGETEVLLCAHHLRASADTLAALAVPVYDRTGQRIDQVSSVFTASR